MGLFNWGKTADKQPPPFAAELDALENRLDSFLAKLNERIDVLLDGFMEEAPAIIASDDRYGQAYYRFSSAMQGQAGNMREKVREVREKQIEPVFQQYIDTVAAGSDGYRLLYEWRNRCGNKTDSWEERLQQRIDTAIGQVERKDYEPVFQQMLDTYWQQCKTVNCRQCGGALDIQQVYYHSAYVSCTSCQTQNIFEPGVIARDIEHTARKLAEQRSKHFMDAHEQQQKEEQDLYQQMHALQLAMSFEERTAKKGPRYDQLIMLEARRVQAENNVHELLDKYYRGIFNELNLLLPDLKEHHEKFFLSLQTNYQRSLSKRSTNI
ncbi:hypothetical protein [Chitinophaga agri]|uniref:Uncharacterized protein n=1 Tax=Chitinophaga agri TaxID=2703787 RepID=A0A6B9ZF90_9BACT|nr:hypothetical protein [Chitinophaga agri]QHS60181.1 hypothetical protein GWR21_11390 [Chitinophaga agri]